MECPICKYPNLDGDTYCRGCGKDLPIINCSYCGAPNDPEYEACYACHRPLPKPVEPGKIWIIKLKIGLCAAAILFLVIINIIKLKGPAIAAIGPAVALLFFYIGQFRESKNTSTPA